MIFDNHPLENLNEENDLFGLVEKAKTITSLINLTDTFPGNSQMMAIYGDWGTGKTTLLKYIQQNIDPDKYYPIFFEAWKNEKDENLAFSLASTIAAELEGTDLKELGKEFLTICKDMFIGFAKGFSVRVNHPMFPISAGFSPKEMMEAIEKESEQKKSYSQELETFTKVFQSVEEKLLNKKKNGKLLLLIDDLDRCEPENILNLISVIKLFFTYGKSTIYLCGVDKNAVSKAVQHKYEDIIKAEEYLEKIFDLTFNMPRQYDLNKVFSSFFPKAENSERDFAVICQEFFQAIGFTNPRHIKKVLNKYGILSELKKDAAFKEGIPEIIPWKGNEDKGFVIDSIFVLYFIILLDYYPAAFLELGALEERISIYCRYYYQAVLKEKAGTYGEAVSEIRQVFESTSPCTIRKLISHRLGHIGIQNMRSDYLTMKGIYLHLLPLDAKVINFHFQGHEDDNLVLDQFVDKDKYIAIKFCRYLSNNLESFYDKEDPTMGEFTIDHLLQVMDRFV